MKAKKWGRRTVVAVPPLLLDAPIHSYRLAIHLSISAAYSGRMAMRSMPLREKPLGNIRNGLNALAKIQV